nr:RNA-dependent DNA polymerase [Bacteroidota bacterium]
KAREGKRFKKSVAAFEEYLENEILKLQKELTGKTYQPGNYKSFSFTSPKRK